MDPLLLRDHPGVCDVHRFWGARAGPGAPTVLLEVPHGATRAQDFHDLRAQLRGVYPPDLQDFFFVNTDVGAPDVALHVARELVAREPRAAVLVVVSRIPRTLIDCNRVIDADAQPQATAAGQMTPGLPSYVRDPHDRALLLGRYQAYRDVASAAFQEVCGRGGCALMVHSYAPRSVDVPVDDRIVEHLRAAYQPDKVGTWPLRPPVDLIARDPEGRLLASPRLLAAAEREFVAAGFAVAHGEAYSLHPSTLAHRFATQYLGQTLCLELRRDLLVCEFTPFAEMSVDAGKVRTLVAPLTAALRAT